MLCLLDSAAWNIINQISHFKKKASKQAIVPYTYPVPFPPSFGDALQMYNNNNNDYVENWESLWQTLLGALVLFHYHKYLSLLRRRRKRKKKGRLEKEVVVVSFCSVQTPPPPPPPQSITFFWIFPNWKRQTVCHQQFVRAPFWLDFDFFLVVVIGRRREKKGNEKLGQGI